MYILTILTCTLNTYVTGLHESNFNEHFFHYCKSYFFFIIVKRQPKTNKLQKPFTTQTSLNPVSVNINFTIKDDSFSLQLQEDTRKQVNYKNKGIIIFSARKYFAVVSIFPTF